MPAPTICAIELEKKLRFHENHRLMPSFKYRNIEIKKVVTRNCETANIPRVATKFPVFDANNPMSVILET